MSKVKNYLSLIKFSHTIFAMPFAFIGFIIGISSLLSIPYVKIHKDLIQTTWQKTNVYLINNYYFFILIVLCMIFARSAAMAFNRYLDRNIDAKNPRTAIREIPKGIITAKNALAVVLGYSYTKRFTPLCHLILGLGLSLAPIGAYLAVTGQFALLPILFSIAVIFWVSGFDIIYALQDEEFDKSQQLYSIPAWVGKAKALRVSEFLHLLSAATIVFAGYYGNFGWLYWIGTAIFVLMLGYQHSIVKPNDLRRVNLAFMTANGIASVVFAIFVIADLFINS